MTSGFKKGARPAVVAALFALAAFGLFTRHHRFPFYYHTDEPGKVRQVLTGERNFHHPLLLLRTTELFMRVAQTPRAVQPTVEAGRTISAWFAALAVGALVLMAWQLGGAFAGVLSGALLVTHSVLFELAHYMKEDCALLFGACATFYAMSLYARRPSRGLAAFTGAAAGLAVSGKYLGLAMAGAALLQVVLTRRAGRVNWQHLLIFLAAAPLVFAAINWEIIAHPGGALGGLDNEFIRLEKRADETRGHFQIKYLNYFGTVISVPVLIGIGVWICRRWRNRRNEPPFTWILLAFPFVFTFALGAIPATKERYLLPALTLFCVLGATGLAELRNLPWRRGKIAAILLASFGVAWHFYKLAPLCRQFAVDDRREMIAWIREQLPPDALIAEDGRTKLREARLAGDPAFAFPQKVLSSKRYAADLGSLDELRERGVRYLALCEQDFHSAQRRTKTPDPAAIARERFYRELFAKQKPLWERSANHLWYLHPGLRIYEMPSE